MTLKNGPLVSVIIPAYNCSEHISEAIESVLAQDYPNKEIIVVDDGSTDETTDILASYEEKITLVKQQNSGSAAARNTGIKASHGEFIAFLDADDLWFPGKLSLQTEYMLAHKNIGLVYHDWIVWSPESNGTYAPLTPPPLKDDKFSIVEECSGWIYGKLFSDSIIHTTSAMLRKTLIDKAGMFDESLRIGEDYDYWFRVSRYTQIHKLKAVLSAYRTNIASITNQPSEINYGAIVINKVLRRCGRTGPDGERVPRSLIRKRLAVIWRGFAYLHYERGNPWTSANAFAKTIYNDPLVFRHWMFFLRSCIKGIRLLLFETNRNDKKN